MRLFLTSKGITVKMAPHFVKFVGKGRHKRRVPEGYIIENASDYKGRAKLSELHEYYKILKNNGLNYKILDLKKYVGKVNTLQKKLNSADFIYIVGGNVFYLDYWIIMSGFNKLIKQELRKGLIFAGSSAGTVVSGPTLKYFDIIDSLDAVPDVKFSKYSGLGLTSFVVLPHGDVEKYKVRFEKITKKLSRENYKIITLLNNQALILDNGQSKIVSE